MNTPPIVSASLGRQVLQALRAKQQPGANAFGEMKRAAQRFNERSEPLQNEFDTVLAALEKTVRKIEQASGREFSGDHLFEGLQEKVGYLLSAIEDPNLPED